MKTKIHDQVINKMSVHKTWSHLRYTVLVHSKYARIHWAKHQITWDSLHENRFGATHTYLRFFTKYSLEMSPRWKEGHKFITVLFLQHFYHHFIIEHFFSVGLFVNKYGMQKLKFYVLILILTKNIT